ncbi:hypothetical protein [Nocardioides sp.]|uniref:hypothetical protein n=1 Tax=Nocardioides sp. TaxID=35761 RepID=UPI00260FBCBF|nr:hypothetical protein [Nocardioides sp.]MDI6911049.1 hypothetical protein [Nocardioides sp.]
MTVTPLGQYPVYTAGQTLTAADLNDERDHLVGRDRLLGRTVGFGVAAGLEGTVNGAGDRLTIAPGLAIDQRGEAIMLTAAQSAAIGVIPLEPTPTPGAPTFDFIESDRSGYSVVLVAHVDPGPAQHNCTAQGCEGHARVDMLRADLVVVRGRLRVDTTDFSEEELLTDCAPLTFASTGAVMGGFVSLRTKIVQRVGSSLSAAALAKLQDINLAGTDLLGVQQYKAAFLNEVYVAALDLLRFRTLMSATVLRTAAEPGVVLGWLDHSGGSWVWQCRYRHHWEPPTGLTQALFGGSCQHPDQLLVDRLENLVMSFNPPLTPAPADPPVTFDPDKVHLCRYRECMIHQYPGKRLRENWAERYARPGYQDRIDPLWDPDPNEFLLNSYEDLYPDIAGSGHIEMSGFFGTPADQVKTAVDGVIKKVGIEPHTEVLTLDQAKGIPGLVFASGAGPDDQTYLVKDDQNKLIGVGVVPAALAIQQVGTNLPVAQQQAKAAFAATTTFESRLGEFAVTLDTLDKGVIENRQVYAELKNEQTLLVQQVEEMPSVFQGQVEAQVVTLLANNQASVVNHVDGLMRETFAEVNQKLDTAKEDISRLFGQVGQVGKSGYPGVRVRPEVGSGTVDVLRNVRAALTKAAGDEAVIAPQLAAIDDGLHRMEVTIAAGGNALEENPAALTSVLTSITSALGTAGATASQLKAIRSRTDALGKLLGP